MQQFNFKDLRPELKCGLCEHHLKCQNNHQHDCGHPRKEEEELSVTLAVFSWTELSVTLPVFSWTELSVTLAVFSWTELSVTLVVFSRTELSVTLAVFSWTELSVTLPVSPSGSGLTLQLQLHTAYPRSQLFFPSLLFLLFHFPALHSRLKRNVSPGKLHRFTANVGESN